MVLVKTVDEDGVIRGAFWEAGGARVIVVVLLVVGVRVARCEGRGEGEEEERGGEEVGGMVLEG